MSFPHVDRSHELAGLEAQAIRQLHASLGNGCPGDVVFPAYGCGGLASIGPDPGSELKALGSKPGIRLRENGVDLFQVVLHHGTEPKRLGRRGPAFSCCTIL